jgi:selenocysteine lyase/cysteine desulfurase
VGAAVEYVIKHGPEKTLAKEQGMVQKVIEAVVGNDKFRIYGPKTAENRVGTLSLTMEGYSPQEAGGILDESFNIAVRPGLHCSPYAHRAIGTFPDGTVRISPGHFNTEAEVDALIAALLEMAG